MQIINNKYLSYGPWIFWQDIVRDSSAPIDIKYNGKKGHYWSAIRNSSLFIRNTDLSMSFSGPCHKSCGDYCWGPNEKQCQICECPRFVFPLPPPHFTSLYLFKATQKYPETVTHTKIQHAYTFT